MTDFQKYLYSRYPEIEILKNSIAELNDLDLNKISVDDLKKKINSAFPIITIGEIIWDDRYHIFRVRRNHHNGFKPFNNIRDIGIPPANITPFGRANNQYEPILYGSHQGDLALFESCQNIPEEDRFEPQNFTMAIWKIKANQTLRLAPIMDNSVVQETRPDIKKISDISESNSTKWIESEKVIEGAKLISKFFADQFAKSEINSPSDYKYSSFFTNYIKEMNLKSNINFDGILYPSVAYKFKGDNVAIFPESLYKLEPTKCFSIISYNFDFEIGTLVKGITAEGKFEKNGDIKWVDRL